jgi:arsenite transporter
MVGDRLVRHCGPVVWFAIPLLIQTYGIFAIGYAGARALRLPHNIAAPACLIGASNFFELAVAVAISLFGLHSGAALATVVGVLVEVPVMLSLVAMINRTRHWFP